MEHSKQSWKNIEPIFQKILEHPFNQELAEGILPIEKFCFYLEQDSFYLKKFARSLALIAARSHQNEQISAFLDFSKGALLTELEEVHQFFFHKFQYQQTSKITLASLGYTQFLLAKCSLAPIEVAIAAVMPCFWIYKETGKHLQKSQKTKNPYERWIETYASSEFEKTVQKALTIFEEAASRASIGLRQEMLSVFRTSSLLEWHFWNEAYMGKNLNDI